jgi:formylglycine-generating enzyme required for sulfatase activity
MHGNVNEWCLDWFGRYGDLKATDPIRTERESDARRVLRGGSWCTLPWGCRAAFRHGLAPSRRNHNIGFRVALRLN